MPWAEVGFERLLIIEAFAAFAVPQAGLDHVPAGGNEEFFVGLGDAVPRQTGRLKHVLVTRPAADNEGDGDRDPLARTVVRPAFGARQLREFASGAPAAVGDALPAVHEGEFDLRLARGNLAITGWAASVPTAARPQALARPGSRAAIFTSRTRR